jgi:hypothetical protein
MFFSFWFLSWYRHMDKCRPSGEKCGIIYFANALKVRSDKFGVDGTAVRRLNPNNIRYMNIPPPIIPASSPPGALPKQAATFSLVAPFISFAIGIFLPPQVRGSRIGMIVLGLTSILLIISGLILGIVALAATKRHGRVGIFGKALAGTCINGLLVLSMLASIPALRRASENAKAMQRQHMEQR